jgi:hypothetical protein
MAIEHLLGGPLTENGISSTICMMGTKSSDDKKLPLDIFEKGTRRIRRTNTEGRAAVAKVSTDGYVLYFKFLPELPGIEQAVSLLTHDFLGFGTTLSELFKVPSSLQIPIIISGRMYGQSLVEDSVSECPVLVSLGIEGRTLKEVFRNPVDPVTSLNVLQNLDEYSLYAVILMAILTNPEDGKGDNYIAEAFETKEGTVKYRIIGIDNDHAFVPPLSDAGGNRVKVNTKTILYAFDEITKPIPQKVRALFTVHDLESRLRGWLCQLRGINERYSELFSDRSHNRKLFEKYNSFVGIPFSKDALSYFYTKFIRLRQALFSSDQRLTPLDLFAVVEPFLSGRYGDALRTLAALSPFERFEIIEGKASIKTLSRPIDVLTSYHIPNTAESREAVLRGQHDSPGQATDELEKIMAVAFDAIQSGQLQPFKQLKLGPQIEAALQSINFGKYSSFEETDQFLKVIQDKLPLIQRLTLKYHPSISTAHIKTWTEDVLKRLTHITLEGCPGIDDKCLIHLADHADNLKYLDLSNNNALHTLARPSFSQSSLPLTFKNLTHLDVSGCTMLKQINLIAPELETFNARNAQQLGLLKGKFPKLRFFNMQGVQELGRLGMVDFIVMNPAFLQNGHLEIEEENPSCPVIREARQYLNGKLIYTAPNGNKTELPIAALPNPFEHCFNLSQCGSSGNYLSINSGYRSGQKAENANKVEVWIAPRFLVEKELSRTARHFQPILDKWNLAGVPVGLFWTCGEWSNSSWYDYLVTDSFERISDSNLNEKWRGSTDHGHHTRATRQRIGAKTHLRHMNSLSCFAFAFK